MDDIAHGFNINHSELEGVRILIAFYSYEDYIGTAWVLFERDGKLYAVHGGYCSCYGLEGQWDPEETSTDYLRNQLEKGRWHVSDDDLDALRLIVA